MSKRTYDPRPVSVPALPAGAVGFLSRRTDRPERLALFHADGTLSSTFAIWEGETDIAAALQAAGMTLLPGGAVVRG